MSSGSFVTRCMGAVTRDCRVWFASSSNFFSCRWKVSLLSLWEKIFFEDRILKCVECELIYLCKCVYMHMYTVYSATPYSGCPEKGHLHNQDTHFCVKGVSGFHAVRLVRITLIAILSLSHDYVMAHMRSSEYTCALFFC